ncbi:hypothetical protein ACA910_000567 [Epithemia clementina (nom. ined.)]
MARTEATTHPVRRSSRRLQGLPPSSHTAAPIEQPNHDSSTLTFASSMFAAIRPQPQQNKKRTVLRNNSYSTTTTSLGSSSASDPPDTEKQKAPNKRARTKNAAVSLPRTQETCIREKLGPSITVIGIDEAGRGPLAGPVVAAAAYVPTTVSGICDSKKITKEEDRQELFDQLVASPDILWAAAIMDASYIDEVNILQATLHGMALSAQAVIHMHKYKCNNNDPSFRLLPLPHIKTKVSYCEKACVSFQGCYIVTNQHLSSESGLRNGSEIDISSSENIPTTDKAIDKQDENAYYALIDGNRMPAHMPCPAETMIKGDGREYSIAAASIVAKVIRDNLMRGYHELYPSYDFQQHKGYPTAAHVAIIKQIGGVSPIHRRSFQPLKSMQFDDDGKLATSE